MSFLSSVSNKSIVLKKSVSTIDQCDWHMTTAQIDLQPTIRILASVRGALKFAENSEKQLFQHNKSITGISASPQSDLYSVGKSRRAQPNRTPLSQGSKSHH
jgi:hypothetical protein